LSHRRQPRSPVAHLSAGLDRRVKLLGGGFRLHQPPALQARELADRAARLVRLDDRIELEHPAHAAGDPLVVVADVLAGRLEALDWDPLGALEGAFAGDADGVVEVDAAGKLARPQPGRELLVGRGLGVEVPVGCPQPGRARTLLKMFFHRIRYFLSMH